MTATVGVLLSGCGVFDGAEIHEAVLTLLFLDRAGATSRCMAPDTAQMHVINHLTQEITDERRNVLVESARIARGAIQDVGAVSAADLDALIIPGGFGAAKNLSDFAVKGPKAKVHPEVRRLLNDMAAAGKPIGAICIAPATLTRHHRQRRGNRRGHRSHGRPSPHLYGGHDPGGRTQPAGEHPGVHAGPRHQGCRDRHRETGRAHHGDDHRLS